jgi:hypothetical protein
VANRKHEPGSLQLGPGSLYAALPIPAFKTLAEAGEHSANRVLTALVSHLGKDLNLAFPSYETLCRTTGMNRNSVSRALKVLYDYGFVYRYKTKTDKHWRNNYLILPSAYNYSKFTGKAAKAQRFLGVCRSCEVLVNRSDVGVWGNSEGFAHFGCGGLIKEFKFRGSKAS